MGFDAAGEKVTGVRGGGGSRRLDTSRRDIIQVVWVNGARVCLTATC